MIPTREQAIGAAREWQGYRDNSGAKVWQAYAPVDYTGSSYCGAGQGMLCKQLGLPTTPTTHERIIYVPWVVDDARGAGKWILSKDSNPGDWVIFSWGNGYHDIPSSNADHIGMIVANDPTLSTVTTFEFNTTDGTGTGVRGAFVRTRSRNDIMGCVDRQDVYAPDPPKPVPPKPPAPSPYIIGPLVTRAWQKYEGTTTDGNISSQDAARKNCVQASLWPTIQWTSNPDGSQLIKAVQRRLHVPADGILGPVTAEAIQGWLKVTKDGVLGPVSTAALAHKLGFK